MLGKFGLHEQAQLKKHLEQRANEQRNKPLVFANMVKPREVEAASLVNDIEEFSNTLAQFNATRPMAAESRREILLKTDHPLKSNQQHGGGTRT